MVAAPSGYASFFKSSISVTSAYSCNLSSAVQTDCSRSRNFGKRIIVVVVVVIVVVIVVVVSGPFASS